MAIEEVAFVVPDPLGKDRGYFCLPPPPTPHMTHLGIGFPYHNYGVAPWIPFVHPPILALDICPFLTRSRTNTEYVCTGLD